MSWQFWGKAGGVATFVAALLFVNGAEVARARHDGAREAAPRVTPALPQRAVLVRLPDQSIEEPAAEPAGAVSPISVAMALALFGFGGLVWIAGRDRGRLQSG
jgi:hypothetical protein